MFLGPRRLVRRPHGGRDLVARPQELAELRDQGVLSPDEFEAAKRKVLRDALGEAGGVPMGDASIHPSDIVAVGLLAAEEEGGRLG